MKNIIEKIIGIDAETQKRAIVSIITYIVDGLYLFGGITIPDEKVDYIIKGVLALVTAVVWVHGFYMNENFTEAGCEGTGYTRLKKLADKGIDIDFDLDEEMTQDTDYEPVIDDIED